MTEHHGQHARCRACGTNDRTIGANPRGPRPPTTVAPEPSPPAAIEHWPGPEHDPDAGPVIDDPRPKLAAARQALAAARKPPPGPTPVPTRGAVHADTRETPQGHTSSDEGAGR